ncbi:MAG: tRNA 2-selenouridine(34) synthase MnmH [Balneolales bacterium]|nr:tRNA 2-selenouridine(34) synthase MnmH [Balneolales bacterium]
MQQTTNPVPITEFLAKAKDLPVFDVRTPGEFGKGHIPGAMNLPLFSDEERVVIGTMYKQQGRDAAVKEGLKFVGPKLHAFVDAVGETRSRAVGLYCWRGGMRSGSMAWLLQTAGFRVELLKGGYKSYRKLIKSVFEPLKIILVSGNTGSGKTELLHALRNQGAQVLDLEELAHHKGSAFGAIGESAQPTTEQFQNEVIAKVLALDTSRPVYVEDESITIGQVVLPDELFGAMGASPWIELQVPKADRVKRLVSYYGNADPRVLAEGIGRVKKKLGGIETREALDALSTGELDEVASILLTYYDRMYQKGIKRKNPHCLGAVSVKDGRMDEAAAQILNMQMETNTNTNTDINPNTKERSTTQ